jgi:hypothetical protein
LGHLEVSNEKTNAKCEKLSGKVNDPSNKKSFREKFVISQWKKKKKKKKKKGAKERKAIFGRVFFFFFFFLVFICDDLLSMY